MSNIIVVNEVPLLCAGYNVEVAANEDKVFAVVERPCFRIATHHEVLISDPLNGDFTTRTCSKHFPYNEPPEGF